VLVGGNACSSSHDPVGTWEWDGGDWQQVETGDGPGTRGYGPGMAYDRARGRTVLFGGSVAGGTWTWEGPTYRCTAPIAGDINCDGVVDLDDSKIVDAARGEPTCAADDTRDLDGGGIIGVPDRKLLESMCTYANCARSATSADTE